MLKTLIFIRWADQRYQRRFVMNQTGLQASVGRWS
jgi:hypothetical protein